MKVLIFLLCISVASCLYIPGLGEEEENEQYTTEEMIENLMENCVPLGEHTGNLPQTYVHSVINVDWSKIKSFMPQNENQLDNELKNQLSCFFRDEVLGGCGGVEGEGQKVETQDEEEEEEEEESGNEEVEREGESEEEEEEEVECEDEDESEGEGEGETRSSSVRPSSLKVETNLNDNEQEQGKQNFDFNYLIVIPINAKHYQQQQQRNLPKQLQQQTQRQQQKQHGGERQIKIERLNLGEQ